MRKNIIIFMLFFHGSIVAFEDLQLSCVLETVAKTHPKLEEAQAKVEIEFGREIASGKAFEPMIKADSLWLPSGFYQYYRLATWVEQTLPVRGISVSGGYRRSEGNVPSYYGEYETRPGGEGFAKIAVPILGGSRIDKERAEICKARLAVEASSQEMAMLWLQIARDTTLAYWEWVAAGQRFQVARNLLSIAEERAERIAIQVENGALPQIVLIDNEGLLLSRRSFLLKAEETFISAQTELSLFYRDIDNTPLIVNYECVPKAILGIPIDDNEIEKWADEIIACRPDLLILDLLEEEAMIELDLARNLNLPKLDLSTYVARDIGPGKESLGKTDVGIGMYFSLPLYRRESLGNRCAAHAKLSAISAERRALRDKIEADLRKLVNRVRLSRERLELASDRLVATNRLADAEKLRLEEGASELLTLNLRELAVASAVEDAISASFDAQKSLAELLYVRGVIFPEK